MEFFTLDRGFLKTEILDAFTSAIWTERYFGNGDFQLVVPATPDMFALFPKGQFVSSSGSKEVMIVETLDSKEGVLTIKGTNLLQFLKQRFIRVSASHAERYWYVADEYPGKLLWDIIYYMCVQGSYPVGIADPSDMVIPGLDLDSYDTSDPPEAFSIPYGTVYDAIYTIATAYKTGMSLTLASATEDGYSILFKSYKGVNRTSTQSDVPIVRFGSSTDSLSDIEEIESIANYVTNAYAFAPNNTLGMTTAGHSVVSGSPSGFDLRAVMIFDEDITTDNFGGDPALLLAVLNIKAANTLNTMKIVHSVDGQIIPQEGFTYGVDYFLGDVIEMEGDSGVVQPAMITEYIRSQDSAGETAYPTVELIT